MTTRSSHKCAAVFAAACALAGQSGALAADNPLERGGPFFTATPIEGRWNGANIERRSNCNAAQNNGTHGTYAEFLVSTNTAVPTPTLVVTQNGITGLVCNYYGDYHVVGNNRSAEGTYSCSDGKTGRFTTRSILASAEVISIRMDIVLSGSETCSVDSIIAGAHLSP